MDGRKSHKEMVNLEIARLHKRRGLWRERMRISFPHLTEQQQEAVRTYVRESVRDLAASTELPELGSNPETGLLE